MSDQVIDHILSTHPGLAGRLQQGSSYAAIRLFCLHCMGGSPQEVKACTAPKCPLYAHRSGKRPGPVQATEGEADAA